MHTIAEARSRCRVVKVPGATVGIDVTAVVGKLPGRDSSERIATSIESPTLRR